MSCATWNPVVRVGVPYDPLEDVPEGPPQAELDKMSWKEFNEARTKALRQWYFFCRRLWQSIPTSRDKSWQEDEIVDNFYRPGREAIFHHDSEEYGCHYYYKKFWDRSISFSDSWAASMPDWYGKTWVQDLLDRRKRR